MRNNNLKGGLFDGRGKPQPLQIKKKAEAVITPEKHIQSALIQWRDMFKRQYPILNSIFSIPNGAMMASKAIAISQVRQGMTSGIPDCICLAPSFDGKYHALLIEFKNEIGKESPEQIFFREFFTSLGYRAEVCRNWWSAGRIVNEHLNLKIPVYGKD